MTHPIRFGLIGLDHWYAAVPLAHGLAAHADTELVAIADRSLDRAREVAAAVGGPRATTSFDELLDDPDIDAIASFVSIDQNADVCVRAAAAGKHIVSIKPLALNLDDATRVVRAVEEAGVAFIPAESRSRETDLNQRIRELVRGGALGTIVSANYTLCGTLPQSWPGATDSGWWTQAGRAPGGGWIDHAIYQIDRTRWLLGSEPVSVSGRIANLVHRDLVVEDYGHAIIEFADGVVATMEDTWAGPAGGWRITTTINGTAGSLAIDTVGDRLSVLRVDGETSTWQHEQTPNDDSDRIQPIVDRIRGERTSLGTVRDAWNNLAACVAFYEAARSHKPVRPLNDNDVIGATQ